MNKIFFFDIDGTLSMRGNMCPSTIESLKELKRKGYLVFICTGRPPFYAKQLFQDLVSGYVTCNGRCIIYDNSIIFEKALSEEQIKYYSQQLITYNAGYYFNGEDGVLIGGMDEKSIDFITKEYGVERVWKSKNKKLFYNFDLTYSSLQQRDFLIELLKDTIIVNDHGGMGSADCSLIEFDKGHAIAFLLEYFKISKENAFAFGDGFNDQAMFREVDHKIAMENGVKELKEKASYITTSVLEDGIWNALIHFEIIKDNE